MYNHILCPIDLHKNYFDALIHAYKLAKLTGAKITLLHASDAILTDDEEMMLRIPVESYHEKEQAVIMQSMDKIRAMLDREDLKGLTVDVPYHIKIIGDHDNAARSIVNYANNNEVDLIAISTTWRKISMERFTGILAEKIMHLSTIPVLVVRRNPHHD